MQIDYLNYLFAGQIFGGIFKMQLFQSDSPEYLERLVILHDICQKIDITKIELQSLQAYGMTVEQLVKNIDEINRLFETAVEDHSNEILRIKLSR